MTVSFLRIMSVSVKIDLNSSVTNHRIKLNDFFLLHYNVNDMANKVHFLDFYFKLVIDIKEYEYIFVVYNER